MILKKESVATKIRSDKHRHSYRRRENSVIWAICLMLFIFSASVMLVLNFRILYYLDIVLLDIEKMCGRPVSEIRANYDALISYNSLFFRGGLTFPTLPMSREAAIHFEEVKRIFDGIAIVCIVTGAASLAGYFINRRKGHFRYLRLTGILCLAVPALLGTVVAASWDRFFITFHRLVFRNDYWLFDPATDPVIEMLPDTYFLHCAAGILILIVAGSVWCLIRYRLRKAELS